MRARSAAKVAILAVLLALLAVSSAQAKAPSRWQPLPGTSWQWQLDGTLDLSVRAAVFNVDLYRTTAAEVQALHARGRRVICYVSAGSWEDWRDDAGRFDPAVLGRPLDGWPDERWLDVRRLDLLAPILRERIDLCAAKGFDGIEFDNVDAYVNPSGFPLTAADQLRFNRFLAAGAHARGLAAGLKNDLPQIRQLEPVFDFAVNEQCFEFRECGALRPFIRARKAVFHVEYALPAARFCARARALRFSSLRKRLGLGAWRQACSPR